VSTVRVVARTVLLLALVALVVPAATVQPATLSLSGRETAKSVDFKDGVVWVLVLGRDAEDHTDTIELLAFDGETGAAAGIGIPRDSWVSLPDGKARINEAWSQGGGEQGGPELAARAVEDLVGVVPDFVLVTGFEGFLAMSEAVGEVEVRSPLAFESDGGMGVKRGLNRFDGKQALDFASSRDHLPKSDFDRMANNQALLLGYLRSLRAHEHEKGFMEDVTLAALGGLETDLAPTDLYRLAQAVTQVDPERVTGCLVLGTPFTSDGGAKVIDPNEKLAQRLGSDADRDATLDPGCRG
jgi:polyisoprenyl-teichoic acid--peptidoglycan teichoic acid transferase